MVPIFLGGFQSKGRKNIMEKKVLIGLAAALIGAAAFGGWFLTRPVEIGVILCTETTLGND